MPWGSRRASTAAHFRWAKAVLTRDGHRCVRCGDTTPHGPLTMLWVTGAAHHAFTRPRETLHPHRRAVRVHQPRPCHGDPSAVHARVSRHVPAWYSGSTVGWELAGLAGGRARLTGS